MSQQYLPPQQPDPDQPQPQPQPQPQGARYAPPQQPQGARHAPPTPPAAPPPPRRGLPGWAIALIVVGSVVVLGLATGGALITARLLTAAPMPVTEVEVPQLPEAEEPAPADPLDDGPVLEPVDPDAGTSETESGSSVAVRSIGERYDSYLAMWQDESIYELLPDGKSVHPDYIAAFLYTLADYKGAARIATSLGEPSAEEAAELQDLVDKTDALEKRFLAGEDLDVSVKYTREDGSVFETDGKYRTVD